MPSRIRKLSTHRGKILYFGISSYALDRRYLEGVKGPLISNLSSVQIVCQSEFRTHSSAIFADPGDISAQEGKSPLVDRVVNTQFTK